jgi:SET domain-containing protein
MKNNSPLEKYYNLSPEKIGIKESDYLYVNQSQIPDSGKGLFTTLYIYKDEIISVFKGEILTEKNATSRSKNKKDGYFINMPDGTIMDSMNVKCFAKYANDAEGLKKAGFKNNSFISMDEQNRVCVVAKRNIKVGEEVFCSYGKKYWKNITNN